ncbi:hypothetical protein HON36_02755 [Candidatus Parcubacteria bacterium]|jgi:hypothetical protein|nr:hypothetical protein [Candidatus Parcubacteria bacterium]MBT7228254.1 hypothetical protein [Candidatus Parcubacteria bacterium]
MGNKMEQIENINQPLQQEILAMVEVDQNMRETNQCDPEIDRQNALRMKEIITEFGWPGKSLVGAEAAYGAWLLIQHADHDIDFQKQALELLKEATTKGEAEKKNEAYLTDRILVNSGRPQIFGTQFYTDDQGNFGPRPIENIEELNKRREEVGLGKFSDYEQEMQELEKKLQEKK